MKPGSFLFVLSILSRHFYLYHVQVKQLFGAIKFRSSENTPYVQILKNANEIRGVHTKHNHTKTKPGKVNRSKNNLIYRSQFLSSCYSTEDEARGAQPENATADEVVSISSKRWVNVSESIQKGCVPMLVNIAMEDKEANCELVYSGYSVSLFSKCDIDGECFVNRYGNTNITRSNIRRKAENDLKAKKESTILRRKIGPFTKCKKCSQIFKGGTCRRKLTRHNFVCLGV